MLRPARPVAPEDTKKLKASYIQAGSSHDVAKRNAVVFVQADKHLKAGGGLKYAAIAFDVASKLTQAPMRASNIDEMVKTVTGKLCTGVIADARFDEEEARLADSLVAMKLLSDSAGGDAPGLARIAQGYDAIRLVAGGRDPVTLRVLTIDEAPPGAPPKENPDDRGHEPKPEPPKDEKPARDVKRLQQAMAALKGIPAASFHSEARRDDAEVRALTRIEERLASLEKMRLVDPREAEGEKALPPEELPQGIVALNRGVRPWVLSRDAISALAPDVRETLAEHNIDLASVSLPTALGTLNQTLMEQQFKIENASVVKASALVRIGSILMPYPNSNDYVGAPSGAMPAGHGSIRPVGVGDLLMVKEHVLRYEGGDLAHVENVLKSESISRDTRRLERTETTILAETETTKEETRDTQTTDRFSLKRETSDTIKADMSLKAGLSVAAKYGPFVEVKASADFATSTSAESSAKQASEFSKDVVARSASKLVERVLERRSTTTINEFEEKYHHVFDNTAGAGHISGFYQWIDKVMQAQVYNYGKRLLFDVTLPEPGTNFILTQVNAKKAAQSLEQPAPFTISAKDITEGNYRAWAKTYDATGVEPPPLPVKTVSKAYDAVVTQDPHEVSKSETLAIDDGYIAKYALVQHAARAYAGASLRILVGVNYVDGMSTVGYYDMADEVASVPVAIDTWKVRSFAITIEIFCERTDRAYDAWKIKTHAAITQAYLAKQQAYEQALAQAEAAAGVVIAGRNPIFNAKLVADELRKQCITLVTAQQFDAFGALTLTGDGYAQPNLARSAAQMPYVRFFEQAFEWEHIVYFFYPYFWGWKPGWKNRMLLDDVDPRFGDFLRAGAARVVFPVRPGFEAAVIHYLETGEIWSGGPPPDISSSLYVPIIQEIQEATGAPGSEVAQGDPWEVRLPTTLVRIRPNDDVPEWKKVDDVWQATN
jgi:hypothetical protein